jgi:hypothetical protein
MGDKGTTPCVEGREIASQPVEQGRFEAESNREDRRFLL